MSTIPFYVGNIVSCFVPNGARRARVRGSINTILYTPRIKRLIKRVYKEKIKTIKFVRQINLNRFACVVNDKYYVKVFRNISAKRLQDHKFLVDFVRPYISVNIPEMYLEGHTPMYVTEKIQGHPISDFDVKTIFKNENKIKKQISEIIKEIQQIDIDSIPDHDRFWFGLQPERQPEQSVPEGVTAKPVLAHFDLNETNLFFDDDMNIIGIIDWDTLSIAKNPETDMNVFNLFWNMFKRNHNIA
jgi:serine/threonine protein kinase